MRFCALQEYHGTFSTLAAPFPAPIPRSACREPLPVAESRDGEARGVHPPNDRAGHAGSEQKCSAYMDLSFLAVPRVYDLRTLLLSSMAQERRLRPVLPME
jgi:hypothetical protein